MSVLRNLETKIAGLVEGTFGRVFRSEVRPVELARELAREMDQHKTVSVSRTYVPNEYVVWLSPEDRARYEGAELVDDVALDALVALAVLRGEPDHVLVGDIGARHRDGAVLVHLLRELAGELDRLHVRAERTAEHLSLIHI